jgi:hypothetical protein
MPPCDATVGENHSPLAKGAARSDGGREAPGGYPFGPSQTHQDNPLKASRPPSFRLLLPIF